MATAGHQLLTHFAHPWALSLLGLLPLLWMVATLARLHRRQALAQLGSRAALLTLMLVRQHRRRLRDTCFALGMIFLIVAIAGPQWGPEPQPLMARGRDLVVVLDVSRSMLAEDVLPSRLVRARQSLVRFATSMQQHGGNRLALVAFAGQARVICPLTPDYDHFRDAVENLDTADPFLAPKAVDDEVISGTRMGQGLIQAVGLRDPRFRDHQDVLMISDGDDPAADGEWQVGLAAAQALNMPVFTVGVGDPDRDCPIPDRNGRPLIHDGKEVRTRLREAPLEAIARQTGGRYWPARTGDLPLDELFRVSIQPRPVHETTDDQLPTYRQRYPWFFGAALALLTLATLISDRPTRSRDESKGISDAPRRSPQSITQN